MERLTLQQMIDSVLASSDAMTMSKIAEEAKEDEDDKKKERPRTVDVERQADKEEAHRGGGTNDTDYSKTAAQRVEKLAAAVEEIVSHFKTAAAEEASSNVGPGRGPGASKTNIDSPVAGEQPEPAGNAKTKIPLQPSTEAGANPKNPNNQMETNENELKPAYPKDGVLKQGTALEGLVSQLAKSAAAPGTGERYQGVGDTVLDPESYRAQELKAATTPRGGAIGGGIGGAVLGGALGAAPGIIAGRPGLAVAGGALGAAGGGAGGALLGRHAAKSNLEYLQNAHPELLEAVANHEMATQLHEAGRISDEQLRATAFHLNDMMLKHHGKPWLHPDVTTDAVDMSKEGADAEGGEGGAVITAPKSSAVPEEKPSEMKRPGDVGGLESHLQSNESVINAKKDELKGAVRKHLAEVLAEPALTSSTDPVLDQALGAGTVNEAGAKIAAEARQYFSKVASEGCSCGSEKGSCRHCVVAAVLRKTANKKEG